MTWSKIENLKCVGAIQVNWLHFADCLLNFGIFYTREHDNMITVKSFIVFFQNGEFYVCIYAQRNCDTILFHHEGGVEIGDVDSKVKYFKMISILHSSNTCKGRNYVTKNPHSMVIFLINVRRPYPDLSSQADPASDNWTWSYTYFNKTQ